MTRPGVAQVRSWDPAALSQVAAEWEDAARRLVADVDAVLAEIEGGGHRWTGTAAEAAAGRARRLAGQVEAAARILVTAAVAAADGAEQIAAARHHVLALVEVAHRDGLSVADDGTVQPGPGAGPLLRMLAGGDPGAAADMLAARAARLSVEVTDALRRVGAADADAAADIAAVFASAPTTAPVPAPTVPAGAWPVQAADIVDAWPAMSQDRIAAQIAAMTPHQRDQLVTEFPHRVGNTDGVP